MNGWTFHGGRLSEARAAYRDAPRRWLDLSTGINPHAWPHAATMMFDWAALPDERALGELEAVAADHFGVGAAHVCALPGTEIGLRLLGEMLSVAAHVAPGYRTHREMAGGIAVSSDDLATIEGSIILANPNNPDGRVTSRDALAGIIAARRGSADWLVVDEAFADLMPEISVAGHISDDQPLVIFRSFGKFFGLAGVRLGFVLGPRALIAQVRRRLGSWPASTAAIAIGTAAYRDVAWIEAMRSTLTEGAAALDAVLASHGLVARGACPLFRLIEVDDAAALFDKLARQGILTRPFDDDPRWLRFGLPGSAQALARLDGALGDG